MSIEQHCKACQKLSEAMGRSRSSSLQKGTLPMKNSMGPQNVQLGSAGQGAGPGGGLKVSTGCRICSQML